LDDYEGFNGYHHEPQLHSDDNARCYLDLSGLNHHFPLMAWEETLLLETSFKGEGTPGKQIVKVGLPDRAESHQYLA